MRVTWWGHSTIGIETARARLLTDPVLVNRIGHLRRRRGVAPADAAAGVDAVLISHLHADHLHLTSLRLLGPGTAIVLPRGAAALVARECGDELGARCVEVEPGDSIRFGDVTVTAVPAAHDRRRAPWSNYSGQPVGYRLDAGLRAWFAGDTDLYDDLASAVGPVDLALVPVGGWGPNLGPGHLDPARAAEAVHRVGASTAVPVHFGTFWPIGLDWLRPELFHRPGERFVEAMAGNGVRVCLLAPGESTRVEALDR